MDKETGGEPYKDVKQTEKHPESMQRSIAGSGAQRVQTECQREMLFALGHAR